MYFLFGENVDEFELHDVDKESCKSSYLETYNLLYAPQKKIIKTHKEVELVLQEYNWRLLSDKPKGGWVDYLYDNGDEIQPIACLSAPPPVYEYIPIAMRKTWQKETFHPTLECVQQFANQVNTITDKEIFVVEPRRGTSRFLIYE